MILILASLPLRGNTGLGQPASGDVAPSFRSIMERSGAISHATFEKEVFLAGIPPEAKKQTFDIVLDGTNYVLNTGPVSVGRFLGAAWEISGRNLVLSDPAFNTNTTPTAALEVTTRLTVDTFVNFGIWELVRASAVWDEGNHRIAGQSSDGSEILIELETSNGVPVKATIRPSRYGGEAVAYIRYQYDAGFFDGRVPVSFTRYASGAPDEQAGRLFTVTIRKLQFPDAPLPLERLNPRLLFKEQAANSTIFYSNNAPYWIRKGAKRPQKVLTAEAYSKSMEGFGGSPARALFWRRLIQGSLFAALVLFPGIYFLLSVSKKSK